MKIAQEDLPRGPNIHYLGGKTYAELPQDDPKRATVMTASFLVVHGRVQRAEGVIHVVAEGFTWSARVIASPSMIRIELDMTTLVTSRDHLKGKDFNLFR